MFGFKKKKDQNKAVDTPASETPATDSQSLEHGLEKTRTGLFSGLKQLFTRDASLAPDLLEEIEDRLLMSDVGIAATERIMQDLRKAIKVDSINTSSALFTELRRIMVSMLSTVHKPLDLNTDQKPAVLMMVGVNGVGKTTTIGKLARQIKQSGQSVMLAAGDTFRAAAIEQLQAWGDKNQVPVIAQSMGSDSAAIIFDALASARSKNTDILIADTAGRLHTKSNLMEELKKVRRVINKFDETLEPEVLLVLDATTGQNALVQAREFHQHVNLTGIALTKLDGTAKGGIIFALANELELPIYFIGIGEKVEDLREFDPNDFVKALIPDEP